MAQSSNEAFTPVAETPAEQGKRHGCSQRISRGFTLFPSMNFSKSPMSNRTDLPNLTNGIRLCQTHP